MLDIVNCSAPVRAMRYYSTDTIGGHLRCLFILDSFIRSKLFFLDVQYGPSLNYCPAVTTENIQRKPNRNKLNDYLC